MVLLIFKNILCMLLFKLLYIVFWLQIPLSHLLQGFPNLLTCTTLCSFSF